MPRCEDYPCCGHESGDCPDPNPKPGYSGYRCVGGCGKPLRKNARSSICDACMRRAERRFAETGEMWPDR